MSRRAKSLRLRLVLGLTLASSLLWGGVALWRFNSLEHEINAMLDERLAASAKMVAGIVHQLQPTMDDGPDQAGDSDLAPLIARDGVACEVSLVRSEVGIVPIARTAGGPEQATHGATGFGVITKGGKTWRSYVLEEDGLRVATADRMDSREHLVQSAWRAMAVPFALALAGIVLLSWWITTRTLRPLGQLQQELRERPPQDSTPVQAGQDTQELAPVVDSLNHLLARMDAAIAHERRWTADAAHELRTPLTAIKTHVQVAQMALATPATHMADQALVRAGEGIAHMQHTLEQLLRLSRIESGSDADAPLCQGPAIAHAAELAMQQSRRRAEAEQWPPAQIRMTQTPAAAAHWQTLGIALPPALLTCAITNLLDNALRHHQGSEPVELALQGETLANGSQQVTIAVRDRGPGLSPQECAQAQQRFWRKTSSHTGSGLGLTIVRRIADSAGGSLTLEPASPGLLALLQLPAHIAPSGQG